MGRSPAQEGGRISQSLLDGRNSIRGAVSCMMDVEAFLVARPLHPLKRWLRFINKMGVLGVLGSCAWGLIEPPGAGASLWGGTPGAWEQDSSPSMLPAALGSFDP
jgi:hypothetical protein